MRFNYETLKEDVRKIGVALFVASLVMDLLKDASFFDVIYPFFWGGILIVSGSITVLEKDDE